MGKTSSPGVGCGRADKRIQSGLTLGLLAAFFILCFFMYSGNQWLPRRIHAPSTSSANSDVDQAADISRPKDEDPRGNSHDDTSDHHETSNHDEIESAAGQIGDLNVEKSQGNGLDQSLKLDTSGQGVPLYKDSTGENDPSWRAALNDSWITFGIDLKPTLSRSTAGNPLHFLPEYKNPCWIERIPNHFHYQPYEKNFLQYSSIKDAAYSLEKEFQQRVTAGRPWRLRCLPYFYIAGVTKAGTTDFYQSLIRHPDILIPWHKEQGYWNRRRYPEGTQVYSGMRRSHGSFEQFVDTFDVAANYINKSVQHGDDGRPWHRKITVDASVSMFWEDNGWGQNPGNEGHKEPVYTTPMAIKAMQPEAKIILLFREPVSRVYSYYYYMIKKAGTRTDFHKRAMKAIAEYKKCFQQKSVRACVYDYSLEKTNFGAHLRGSFYAEFLQDWLRVFSKDNVLIIKSEDYYANRSKYANQATAFLGLEPLPGSASIREGRVFMKSRNYPPILNHTKTALAEFFRPFTEDLYSLSGQRFWD